MRAAAHSRWQSLATLTAQCAHHVQGVRTPAAKDLDAQRAEPSSTRRIDLRVVSGVARARGLLHRTAVNRQRSRAGGARAGDQ